MKKIMILVAMLLMPLMACSADYQEGKHYTKINAQPSKKSELREYFSFYCGHCYNYEAVVAELKKQLPANIRIEKNHVDFMRSASPKVQALLSRATVVAQLLNRENELVGALFKYIQKDRKVITSERDIRKLYIENGVDGEEFDKLMKSFTVLGKAKSMKTHQDTLSKLGVLTGVPTFVVNNQYVINRGELDDKDPIKDFAKLVQYLQKLK